MEKNKKFKKVYYYVIGVVILIAGFSFYLAFGRQSGASYDFITVKKGSVVQEISSTGRVRPSDDVDLAFEKSGRLAVVNIDVGHKVSRGQLLVQLDNSDILAQLEGAVATLKVQQAKLDELKKGTRLEEIEVQKVKVENAKISLEDAQKKLDEKIADAYTKSDDATRNKVDQFFSNPRSTDPQLNFTVANSELERQVESERVKVEMALTSWEVTPEAVMEDLVVIKNFLEKTALLINSLTSNEGLSQTTIDGWKSDVSTARTNVNTAISNLVSAKEDIRTENASLKLAVEQLALIEAGTVPEQILAQEAQVEKAAADIRKYEADISKTRIYSPINGIVTKRNAKLGEIVSANTSLISVISESNFEVESNIPEIDVAKIKVGDKAEITLDSYGSDSIFLATVVAIDPAETVIEGMATYKTTLQFDQDDDRVRSGMTANIEVSTGRRDNVIIVPSRSVITKDGEKVVQILNKEDIMEEVKVSIGLKGSDGNIEIISGINEGDRVVTFAKQK